MNRQQRRAAHRRCRNTRQDGARGHITGQEYRLGHDGLYRCVDGPLNGFPHDVEVPNAVPPGSPCMGLHTYTTTKAPLDMWTLSGDRKTLTLFAFTD